MNPLRISHSTTKKTNHVTYIMSSSFRILDNHSLYYAMETYDSFDIVIYRNTENERQNQFFDAFIKDLIKKLKQLSEVTILYNISEIKINNDVVLDQGYLKEELELNDYIFDNTSYGITILESNVAVPVTVVSNKEEYSARTIRPKIYKHLYDFIDPVLEDQVLSSYEEKALNMITEFIDKKLPFYHLRNHPNHSYTSDISPYLKYGIISPIRILILLNSVTNENKGSFIEELIVRRELSYNFVFYNKQYDEFEHITYDWAYQTMGLHIYDTREYLYSIEDYIQFKTHDKYFNTAMKEMVLLGRMHGYMRMYWCKKIIEWSASYKTAYNTAIYLNNKYFLDGNTPNGYTGVAWCFGKHDRAWTERAIFGKLRYMNANGLKRKFDIEKYVEKIEKEVSV